MADLTVFGGDRGGVDDGAAHAVNVGRVVTHGRRGQTTDVERADQVDLDDLAVEIEIVRGGVLAVFADGARRPTDAGAVDRAPQRCHGLCSFDRGDDVVGARDVTVRVRAADLFGDRFAARRR